MRINWKVDKKEENDFYINIDDSASNDKESNPFEK